MLIAMLIAAAATAQAPQPPQPPQAPPRGFVPLTAAPEKDAPARLCSPDRRWCVLPPEPEDGTLYVDKGPTGESYWSPPEGDGMSYRLIPAIAPLKAGGAVLLMQAKHSRGYSGGGADFADWVVLHVAREGPVTRVLTAPASASRMIRACFSERDMEQRAGACHDEYEMGGILGLTDDGSALPPIVLETQARFFPRGIRPGVDSLSLPPLRESDLAWRRDDACSYRRTFEYDTARRHYEPTAPLPDCGQYLDDQYLDDQYLDE